MPFGGEAKINKRAFKEALETTVKADYKNMRVSVEPISVQGYSLPRR